MQWMLVRRMRRLMHFSNKFSMNIIWPVAFANANISLGMHIKRTEAKTDKAHERHVKIHRTCENWQEFILVSGLTKTNASQPAGFVWLRREAILKMYPIHFHRNAICSAPILGAEYKLDLCCAPTANALNRMNGNCNYGNLSAYKYKRRISSALFHSYRVTEGF